jgi:hypothetical protein
MLGRVPLLVCFYYRLLFAVLLCTSLLTWY